jgi:hypothetical protein
MNQRRRKVSAMRVGIIASLIMATLHLILIGGTYIRKKATLELESDRLVLIENLTLLEEINQGQLDALASELAVIEEEISELEISFPELGAPFALFQRAQEFSEKNQVDLSSISKDIQEIKNTTSGIVIIEEYNLELVGNLDDCISFIGEVEEAGLETVIMQSASFSPQEELCFLDIQTLGIINVSED